MSDSMPQFNNSNIEMMQIIPTIPQIISEQSEEQLKQALEYLDNPCIVELTYVDRESGETSDYKVRYALSYIGIKNGQQRDIVQAKGIDFDVMIHFPVLHLAARSIPFDKTRNLVLTYIGRLNDILGSENPPQRNIVFEFEKRMLTESRQET